MTKRSSGLERLVCGEPLDPYPPECRHDVAADVDLEHVERARPNVQHAGRHPSVKEILAEREPVRFGVLAFVDRVQLAGQERLGVLAGGEPAR